jgi:heavy metal translocating P-type ATPase
MWKNLKIAMLLGLRKRKRIKAYHLEQLGYFLCIVVLWLLPSWIELPSYWRYIPLTLALLPIAYEAVMQLYQRTVGTEFFLLIASVVALSGGEVSALFLVLIIMLIARYLDSLIKRNTEDAIANLLQIIPHEVLIKQDSHVVSIPLEEIRKGMQAVILTGGRIPVDGRVVEGHASILQAVLTGESVPVEKGPGELVYAGTFVESETVTIEVLTVGKETYFGRIQALLDQSGQKKAAIVRFTERITLIYTPLFLLFVGLVWLLTSNTKLIITLLIFGTPLELTLITPLTLLAAIVAAFRRGILVKGGASLEMLASTSTMIFDKTGTLTMGAPEVVSVESLHEKYSSTDIVFIAAVAEKKSGHVLAKAILHEAEKRELELPDPQTYESVTGHGIIITFQDTLYIVGNRHFVEAEEHGNVKLPPGCKVDEKLTTFFVATKDSVIGQICLVDRIKPEAREVIAALKAAGLDSIILLSGDRKTIAQSVADQLGIEKAYGEVMPEEKLALLTQLQQDGQIVTMVGDGINDAPALKQAHVGIALGGMGMEPAIQAADIVLMSGNLDQIVFLYDLARAAMKTIKYNLIFGFALTHSIGIILAFLSYITPAQAALFHAIPDMLIMLYGSRLMYFGADRLNRNSSGK